MPGLRLCSTWRSWDWPESRRLTFTSSSGGDRRRLAAEPFSDHAGWVAVASASLDTFDDTMSDVSRELLVGGIVFVAIAGLGAYWLGRAALAPVERLRRQVAARSERDVTSRA